MVATLAEATARARHLFASGQTIPALHLWDRLLAAQPLADDARSAMAAILAARGKVDEAGEIFRALAIHFRRAGRPLSAIVAARALGDLHKPSDYLLEAIATTYAAGSSSLAPFAARPSPLDPNWPLPDDTDALAAADDETADAFERMVPGLVARATDFSRHPPYQEQVHPIAFLSELASDSLVAVLQALRIRTANPGETVVQQGAPGTSLFLVAAGRLRVVVVAPDGSKRQLALISENSLFGETALVTRQPRGASVIAIEPSTVLELARDALDDVRARIPSIEVSLTRFARERLIRNLLATSPLFTPFTKDQQSDLLRRFEGLEMAAGTVVISQGDAGAGLYVVLSGDLDVSAATDQPPAMDEPPEVPVAVPVHLAALGPGDVFGEMSLVSGLPASATVTAKTRAVLMFLPRVYVDRLAEAIPEVRTYFATLAERRGANNVALLAAHTLPDLIVDIDEG